MRQLNDAMTKVTELAQRVRRHWLTCVNLLLVSATLMLLLRDASFSHAESDPDDASMKVIRSRLKQVENQQTRQKRSISRSQMMAPSGGATYTRWGRTVCPSDAELVYAGFTAGSYYTHVGGGTENLCLTDTPEWGEFKDTADARAVLYGAEYELSATSNFPFSGENFERGIGHDENVPCAVCQSRTRSIQLMIPGRLSCYDGWHKEYHGYLMGSHHTHKRASWTCMDAAPEGIQGGLGNQAGLLFYSVEGVCGSLACPPYVDRREITCVVCTK